MDTRPMILLAAMDPNLPKLVLIGLVIISLGTLLRYFHQPYIIAYILAGVLLGEDGFQIITDREFITRMGDFGLILLLFFIGMEVSLPDLVKNWKVATIGTAFQVLASIFLISLIGFYFDWAWNRIIVLGFVISLSSSAVVIKLLQDNKETQTFIGQNVISILLMQDILIVPMLIATNYLGGAIPPAEEIFLQVIGGLLIIGGILWIVKKKEITLPFSQQIEKDHELQVFVALIICLGFAWVTAFFGLSAALGAFVGGIFVHAARSTDWFHDSLHAFRVIFVALFFISVGMLIDLSFLLDNWTIILMLIFTVFLSNHLINAIILHYFGRNWRYSFYGGALVAQVGELSFILAASAYYTQIITDFTYQLTIIVISLTLLISPFWIAGTKKLLEFR
ncbi:MAG: cation:proton antiporter [Bacteroidota bacterium]